MKFDPMKKMYTITITGEEALRISQDVYETAKDARKFGDDDAEFWEALDLKLTDVITQITEDYE